MKTLAKLFPVKMVVKAAGFPAFPSLSLLTGHGCSSGILWLLLLVIKEEGAGTGLSFAEWYGAFRRGEEAPGGPQKRTFVSALFKTIAGNCDIFI